MKRLFSIALTLVLVLSMGMVALAGSPDEPEVPVYKDWSPVTINKDVEIMNPGTVNPEENFEFNVGNGSGVRDDVAIDAPPFDPATFTINIAQGETKGFTDITLPVFTQVGVYTYPINEEAGNTAGMRYDDGDYNLVVTVINDGKGGFKRVLTLTEGNDVKTDAFKNKFYAGDLTIKKVIKGNYSDPNDEFEVTVTVTPKGDKVINADPIDWDGVTPTENGGVYTAVYTVKGDETVTVKNLPYDVDYTVVETKSGHYDVSYDDYANGEIKFASKKTTITNTRDTEVNTGVNLNSLPYFLVLGLAGAGLIGFTVRRRFRTND